MKFEVLMLKMYETAAHTHKIPHKINSKKQFAKNTLHCGQWVSPQTRD